MKLPNFILLQYSSYDSSGISTVLIGMLVAILISIVMFLIMRSVVLWYLKINEIVRNQEKQSALLDQLVNKANANRRNARANYLSALATGDNKQAYECLLYLIFHDLTDPSITDEDEIKAKYTNLKLRYTGAFSKLGYVFPNYPFPSI